jgi:putative oxidoreductase
MDRAEAVSSIASTCSLLARLASALHSPFLLAVRLYWGWQFAESGWGKLHRLGMMTDYFSSLHLPLPALTAASVSGLEFLGGLLLILGLGSRPIGLLLGLAMSVAYLTAERQARTSIFSNPTRFYNADPYTFGFAALLVLVFGPGRFSLDFLISRLVAQWVSSR